VVASPLGSAGAAPETGALPEAPPSLMPPRAEPGGWAGQGPVRNRRLAIPGLRYYIQTGRPVRNMFPSRSCRDGLARV
jgi:hypothetical protein